MLQINRDRFLQNLAELAQIGRLPEAEGGGLDRRPFSPAERAAREFFRRQAEAARLEVGTDAGANLSARLGGGDVAAKTLLLGSHLDTVPHGGPYDGALGVMAALEVLRTIGESGVSLPFHLEAIAFTDEEGRFGDFFGSQALTGGHTAESIRHFLESAHAFADDLAIMSEMVPGGLTAAAIGSARRDPERLAGYIELHIEQGPQLERAGVPIGIVDAIYGRRSMRLIFHGRSDHAGTTPMQLRADALVAAARFVVAAPDLVQSAFPNSVVTCGNVSVKPGVHNVVPNEVTVLVEFRAASTETLARMEKALLAKVEDIAAGAEGVSFTAIPTDQQQPVAMDAAMQAAIGQACSELDYAHMRLSSGALHDAGSLAAVTPSGLFFVPSKGGRSHCPDEDTDADDLVAGANVLLHTVLALAGRGRGE